MKRRGKRKKSRAAPRAIQNITPLSKVDVLTCPRPVSTLTASAGLTADNTSLVFASVAAINLSVLCFFRL
jgi:hypothetical protein